MTPGVVVAKHASERTILTARGPIRFKTSLLDFFLYGGRWEAPVPARILLCVECGLGIAFKL